MSIRGRALACLWMVIAPGATGAQTPPQTPPADTVVSIKPPRP